MKGVRCERDSRRNDAKRFDAKRFDAKGFDAHGSAVDWRCASWVRRLERRCDAGVRAPPSKNSSVTWRFCKTTTRPPCGAQSRTELTVGALAMCGPLVATQRLLRLAFVYVSRAGVRLLNVLARRRGCEGQPERGLRIPVIRRAPPWLVK